MASCFWRPEHLRGQNTRKTEQLVLGVRWNTRTPTRRKGQGPEIQAFKVRKPHWGTPRASRRGNAKMPKTYSVPDRREKNSGYHIIPFPA